MKMKLEWLWGTLATLASVALLAAVVSRVTAGLTCFTSEAWRRAAVAAEPRSVPDALLQDERGTQLRLHQLCGKVLVVDFVYTRCPTICGGLGAVSSRLAQELQRLGVGDAVVLSVSFDPANDTPDALAEFKLAMERAPSSWRLARPRQPDGLRRLLATFGVVALPDGAGGFEHNAALHVVDRSCRLARVLDADDWAGAAQVARRLSQGQP
jgi:protein SCO1/2